MAVSSANAEVSRYSISKISDLKREPYSLLTSVKRRDHNVLIAESGRTIFSMLPPALGSGPIPKESQDRQHLLWVQVGWRQSMLYYKVPSSSQFSTLHLKLLLNWTTSTCYSISRSDTDFRVWQSVIPEQALSCPHLLHGIFAVSSLHLALSSNCQGEDRQQSSRHSETQASLYQVC